MCLYKGSNKMQIASEDIVCYKVIQIYHRSNGDDYRTYFQNTPIELNKPIVASSPFSINALNDKNFLYGEVVHAYRNISCDDSDIGWYIDDSENNPYFGKCDISIAKVECIIPKGTLFCKGLDDDDNLCYGAETIIPKQVIEILSTIERHG